MSTENESALTARLSVFEAFATDLAESLRGRLEGDVEVQPLAAHPTSLAGIASEVGEGALLGRAVWGPEGASAAGCFLWLGGHELLAADEANPAASLTPDEIQGLNDTLRAAVSESGTTGGLEWSGLEVVTSENVGETLREIGVPTETDTVPVTLQVPGGELRFLILAAGEEEEEAEDVVARAAEDEASTEPEIPIPAPEATDEPATEESPADATQPDPEPVLEEFEPEPTDGAAGDAPAAEVEHEAASIAATASPEATDADDMTLPEDLGNLQHLLAVRIPLTIRLGTARRNLEDVLKISPGAILELEQREDEPLEVLANGRVIARGEVVVVDERFGLRITEIGTSAERLQATR